MTAAEVEALGIEPFEGGFIGLPLTGPDDGKFYSLSRLLRHRSLARRAQDVRRGGGEQERAHSSA